MSSPTLTFQSILDDLRDCKITPARSNLSYVADVQSWFFEKIVNQSDLPNNCLSLDNWVTKHSEDITKYLKRIWENNNGRYEAILRNNKEFLDKPVEFPGMYLLMSIFKHIFR